MFSLFLILSSLDLHSKTAEINSYKTHTHTHRQSLSLSSLPSDVQREPLRWTLNKESSIDLPVGGEVKEEPITALISNVPLCQSAIQALQPSDSLDTQPARHTALHAADAVVMAQLLTDLTSVGTVERHVTMPRKPQACCSGVY